MIPPRRSEIPAEIDLRTERIKGNVVGPELSVETSERLTEARERRIVVQLESEAGENEVASTLGGARWWIRTTDPRRVKAVLYR